jgi:hypothetical protein
MSLKLGSYTQDTFGCNSRQAHFVLKGIFVVLFTRARQISCSTFKMDTMLPSSSLKRYHMRKISPSFATRTETLWQSCRYVTNKVAYRSSEVFPFHTKHGIFLTKYRWKCSHVYENYWLLLNSEGTPSAYMREIVYYCGHTSREGRFCE